MRRAVGNAVRLVGTVALARRPMVTLRRAPRLAVNATALQARWAGDAKLNRELTRELKEELARDDKEGCPETPSGWTVNHETGTSFFTMRRTYKDETLDVHCQLQVRDPEVLENQKESNESIPFPFTLVVSKAGQALDYTFSVINNELVLDGIAFHKDASVARDFTPTGDAKRDLLYQGPDVTELNEAVVESFLSYLDDRGVNDSFAEFVASYSFWMEQQEYEAWIAGVADFTK